MTEFIVTKKTRMYLTSSQIEHLKKGICPFCGASGVNSYYNISTYLCFDLSDDAEFCSSGLAEL
jgi:hypothetical protein